MQALLVLVHPNPDSFNHAVADRARAALEARGHTVHLLDLCALGFRAAMSADERHAYHGEQPILDPLVAEHARLVKECEAFVFVYPTWWSAMPAVLKGWLDRVLVPGVGFGFDEQGKVTPGLRHVRHLVGISTYGSPRLYVKAMNDNGRRTVTRTLRLNAGLRTRTRWYGFYAIDTATPAERAAFLDRIERRLRVLR
jgi:putative NADPH-quinone reductase